MRTWKLLFDPGRWQQEPERVYHLCLPAIGQLPWKKVMESTHLSLSARVYLRPCHQLLRATVVKDVQQNTIARWGRGRIPGNLWNTRSTKFDPYCFQQVAWTSVFTCIIYFRDSKDVRTNGTAPSSPYTLMIPLYHTILQLPIIHKNTICSPYIQSLKTARHSGGLWKPAGCPAETHCKAASVSKTKYTETISDCLHVSPPSLTPCHYVGAGTCHMDNVNLCAVISEVWWGGMGGNPGGGPGCRAVADSHEGLAQLGLFTQPHTAYV